METRENSVMADDYAEIFALEVECWCHGLKSFGGDMSPGLVHRVIKELAASLRTALQKGYVFDLKYVAKSFAKAAHGTVDEVDAALSILNNLPVPFELDEEGQFTMAQIIDQFENLYGPVLPVLEEQWRTHKQKMRQAPQGSALPRHPLFRREHTAQT